jgi:hypothetical protein
MNTKDVFSEFPGDSRVWLYQTDRALKDSEITLVKNRLNSFVKEWAAHGNKLWANADILNPYFVVVSVNDSLTPPSGCSIDASVKELQDLGKELNVDFFTRMKVTYDNNGEMSQLPFSELSSINENTLIYDSLISNLKDLRTKFPVSLKDSSFAHLV